MIFIVNYLSEAKHARFRIVIVDGIKEDVEANRSIIYSKRLAIRGPMISILPSMHKGLPPPSIVKIG